MFKCKEHMTQEQLTITNEFQDLIETEYALCVSEIRKINQAIANATARQNTHNPLPKSVGWSDKDCANQSFHSLHKYWQGRLDCLINFIAEKDYKLSEELAKKYLNGIKIRMTL
jgi:hypothetical protein